MFKRLDNFKLYEDMLDESGLGSLIVNDNRNNSTLVATVTGIEPATYSVTGSYAHRYTSQPLNCIATLRGLEPRLTARQAVVITFSL